MPTSHSLNALPQRYNISTIPTKNPEIFFFLHFNQESPAGHLLRRGFRFHIVKHPVRWRFYAAVQRNNHFIKYRTAYTSMLSMTSSWLWLVFVSTRAMPSKPSPLRPSMARRGQRRHSEIKTNGICFVFRSFALSL